MGTRSILPHLEKSGSSGSTKPAAGVCGDRRRSQHVLGVQLDVVIADASARAAALNGVDVHSDFARQTSYTRRSRNRIAMFGARNLAELNRHGKARRRCRGLIRRKRLLFGLALGAHRHLKRKASGLLSRNVFDRFVTLRRRCWSGCGGTL